MERIKIKKNSKLIALLLTSVLIMSSCTSNGNEKNSSSSVNSSSSSEISSSKSEEISSSQVSSSSSSTAEPIAEKEEILIDETNKNSPELFNKILNNINIDKKGKKDDVDIDEHLEDLKEDEEGLNIDDIILLRDGMSMEKILNGQSHSKYDGEKVISKEEALIDLDYLFKTLKHTYGLYEYLGGDTVFLKAKDTLTKILEPYESIKSLEFYSYVFDNLRFIKDDHFTMNNMQPSKSDEKYYRNNEKYEFFKNTDSFYTVKEGKKLKVSSVDGVTDLNELQNFFFTSLNASGEIVYYIGGLYEESDKKLNVTFTSEDETESKEEIKLERSRVDDPLGFSEYNIEDPLDREEEESKYFSLSEQSGIKIIKSKSMMADGGEELAQSFREVKDYPYLIIDLRGNQGGFAVYPFDFFVNYTNEEPNPDFSAATLYSKENDEYMKEDAEYYKSQTFNVSNRTKKIFEDVFKREDALINDNKTSWDVIEPSGTEKTFVKNKSLVVVLVDKNTSSAAEWFVEYLRTMENTVIIGTNTNGMFVGSLSTYINLPTSKINFLYGSSLFLKEGYDEKVGIEPDIWVSDCTDSLNRAISLINRVKE